jgi:phosphoglucosamine mutase
MDSEMALALGRAVAAIFRNGGHKHRIVVGKDTRLSGYMLEQALSSGVCSMGANVCLVGPLPTPGIAFIARSMRADAGVVISASHNSYTDNGIKFFDRHGYKLPDDVEKRMENLIEAGIPEDVRPTGEYIGKAVRIDDATGRYIQFLKNTFPESYSLEGFRIVVDCANGASYKVAPAVFRELGATVIEVGTSPNGLNINRDCGSLYPDNVCKATVVHKAHVGIALDGDADRLIMCDDQGSMIDGDVIMALCADFLNREGQLNKSTLVATVMSNLALDQAMRERGINVVRTAVGDRYVIQSMRDEGYSFGGEQSGHMIFLNHNTTGDGILASLQVLAIMIKEGKSLKELSGILKPYPQIQRNVEVSEKKDLQTVPEIFKKVQDCEKQLGSRGRLVLRYSGTENIARVMVEGEKVNQIEEMAETLVGLISTHLGAGSPKQGSTK